MYQIAPEDRMQMIRQQHEAMRATAARERLAAAAQRQPGGTTHTAGTLRAGRQHLGARSVQVLSAFTWRHRRVGHGAAR